MKKIMEVYDGKLLRPILYRWVYKAVVGLALVLLWDKFINRGLMSVVRDGFFVAGAVFFGLAWFTYLSLDGMSASRLFRAGKEKVREQRKTVRRGGDIMDFTDEHIPRLDELEEDEKQLVFLLSSLAAAVTFLVPALIALIIM